MTVSTTSHLPRPAATSSAGVERITLDGGDLTLSALVAQPIPIEPRATVVALHGAGMNASYFHGQAHADVSLLHLAAGLGYTAVALDRPGYGGSAAALPQGLPVARQAALIGAALADLRTRYPVGGGILLLAHSFGGAVALTCAADTAPADLIGVDVSGCGHRYAPGPAELLRARNRWTRNWGPLRLYPPTTFRCAAATVTTTPAAEVAELPRWPRRFAGVAARIDVPVRLTFAAHESWWRHDEQAIAELRQSFSQSPRVVIEHQPDAGHNISLGWAARAYHLRALGFLEDSLHRRGLAAGRTPLHAPKEWSS